jgi:DNA-binding CsgD family transcriptional regulator
MSPSVERFHTGDPLFTCNGQSEVTEWNEAAEALTGIPADQAVGRRCWFLLCGVDDEGQTVCHAGCSRGRLAGDGWPVGRQSLLIRTPDGRRRVTISTIATERDGEKVFLHLLGPALEAEADGDRQADTRAPALTPRQLEVLRLLSEGMPAKRVAAALGISEATARNHIRAILRELDCHSQLEALAVARRHELV